MSPKKQQILHRLDDPDFRNAEVALRRAAEKAQERARQAGSKSLWYDPKYRTFGVY